MYYYAYAVISREANGDKTLRPLYEGPGGDKIIRIPLD